MDPNDSPDFLPEPIDAPPKVWEVGRHRKEEEFTRAMALALFDYMRKSYSRGFVVSLSGGADSAAVSTLVSLMVEMGTADLGREGFLKKLGYFPELAQAETPREMVRELLTTVYQSTAHSGQVTRNAAKQLADALGCRHYEFDVDAIVNQYVGTVSKALGRELTWGTDDVTLQNIQARVRAPGVWMLANIRGALLLATSNRSEAAVGYATMDGDTAGGLSPIAGIDKAFLRTWLQMDGNRRPRRLQTATRPQRRQRAAAHGGTPAFRSGPNGRSRLDALSAVGFRRALRDPRQANAGGGLPLDAGPVPGIHA